MSDSKIDGAIQACRLLVALGPSRLDEPAIREALGGIVLTSMTQVARALRVSAETVRHTYRRDGLPGEAKRGTSKANRFPLDEILIWWLRRELRTSEVRRGDDISDRTRIAELRRVEAAAELAERRLQEAKGDTVGISLVSSRWDGLLSVLSHHILDLPRNVTPFLCRRCQPKAVQEMQHLVRLELRRISEVKVETEDRGDGADDSHNRSAANGSSSTG